MKRDGIEKLSDRNLKILKREEAEERAVTWRSLSPTQQIESLKSRRGNSGRQMARILAKLSTSPKIAQAVDPEKSPEQIEQEKQDRRQKQIRKEQHDRGK